MEALGQVRWQPDHSLDRKPDKRAGTVSKAAGPERAEVQALCDPLRCTGYTSRMPHAHRRKRRAENGQCANCGKPADRYRCDACAKQLSDYQKARQVDHRALVFGHYGTACTCCGEREPMFLVIDHINGGGTKHRKEVGAGTRFYQWLIKNGLPDGYQVHCASCNHGRRMNGGVCPHKQQGVTQ